MWNGFESKEFVFRECKATIVYPKGKPIGRMIFKTEYLGAFPAFDIAMLEKGYYLIHVQQKNRWAPDEETLIQAEFVRYCAGELDASERCVLEGLSLGGLQAARFAQLYPELTAVVYLDAPVLNILSMAGLGRLRSDFVTWARECIQEAYGVDESTIVNLRESPIDHMDILVENKIPVIMVYGDADQVVIYEENGKVLEEYYRRLGCTLEVICKPGCDHHPHGLKNPQPIIDFVEKHFANKETEGKMWNGFICKEFIFRDRKAMIVYPKENANGRILLKTDHRDAFPTFDLAMLEQGYHLIHLSHHNRWDKKEIPIMAEYVQVCARELNMSDRCVLEGLSSGGMQAVWFAQMYPHLTELLYLDAPALNLLGAVGLGKRPEESIKNNWNQIKEAYGVDESTIVNLRESAIDHMENLIENKIPVIMVYGDADEVAIYEENGKVLEDYYRKKGGILELICKPGCGHHPHGLRNPQPVLDFVEKYV